MAVLWGSLGYGMGNKSVARHSIEIKTHNLPGSVDSSSFGPCGSWPIDGDEIAATQQETVPWRSRVGGIRTHYLTGIIDSKKAEPKNPHILTNIDGRKGSIIQQTRPLRTYTHHRAQGH